MIGTRRRGGSGAATLAPTGAFAALAKAETVAVLRQVPLWVGWGLSALWLFGSNRDELPILHQDVLTEARALIPLLVGAFMAGSLVASRARRAGLEDQLASLPTTRSRRAAAQLLGGAAAALPGLMLLVLYLLALRFVYSGIGAPLAAEAAVWPVAVLVAAWLGTATELWLRSTITMFLGAATIVAIALLVEIPPGQGGTFFEGWRSLGFWVQLDQLPPELSDRRPGAHLVYLLGSAGAVAGIALLRFVRSPATVGATVLATLLVAGSALMQLRPPSGREVASKLAAVTHPEEVQVCEETAAARYCAYPTYAGLIAHWKTVVEPIVQAVPPRHRDRLSVAQRPFEVIQSAPFPRWSSGHLDEFSRLLAGWREDDVIPADFRWPRSGRVGLQPFAMAIDAATLIVGFRPPDHRPDLSGGALGADCNTAGEARTALALWLAGASSPAAEARYRESHEPWRLSDIPDDPFTDGASLGDYGTGVEPVLLDRDWGIEWPRLEAELALELLARPRAEVVDVVRSNWGQLTDPDTPTHEIVELFGLPEPELLSLEDIRIGERCR